MFNLCGRFSLWLLLAFTPLYAQQSFKDFKKAQAESFKSYKDERDNAFEKYLKQEWKAFNEQKPTPLYEEPKPLNITPIAPQVQNPVGPKIYLQVKEDANESVIVEIKPQIIKQKALSFDFFGTKMSFELSESLKKSNFYPQNQSGITNFFSAAASSDYETLVADIQAAAKEMGLNDWGVYLLVTKISQTAASNSDNTNLLSWFLLNKLGYAVKIGLANGHTVLMHYAQKSIYATPRYSFGNKNYYVVANYAKGGVGRIFSYDQEYPNATKELDLSLEMLPRFAQNIQKKSLKFSLQGENYNVLFSYNKNLIDFMATYPQADYETFFNAPLERATLSDLSIAFKEYISGKKASNAINFVLHFVQSAFVYQQDNEQFSREKVMFAQETLYYDKSDCEDRAILFSSLVKEFFGINVVGVKYKDHMATALYIPLEGDSVSIKSKRFVVADPTYVNATLGMSMPKYKDKKPVEYIIVK
ncbi:MAG: hypothetical protein PHX44_04945 [Sulfurimonas sp.]|uniref:hypothetical protein n=1 Tax=Sulfurimonas sp. TaxID=2022749 RepID=UPI002615B14F|nr:hypothetical protein [Sulfurimonas sp.]MDD2652382.1 hypothetical protein [Sulfurimonas sp.]MDD3451142.1 hypothetical protein [Sulfurimonas sp.]